MNGHKALNLDKIALIKWDWLDIFLFQTDWILADARMLRADRIDIRFALERAMQKIRGGGNAN